MCPGSPGPDPLDNFLVRFHYYGSFQQVDGKLDYIGELVAEMFIPRDNLSYRELCNYAEDIHQVERGHCRGDEQFDMYADDVKDDEHVFERFYMCFGAIKKGFLAGRRKVIGLDGCFFKGACFGQLLVALGRDANNQMYPVAWAVVEKETYESWFWFVEKLNRDLKISNQGDGWVFISDQQKGLIGAIEDILPKAEHRMCARQHIYSNWKKKHNDKDLQKRFWRCVKAPNRSLFNYNRARLAQFTVEGAKDMMNTDPIHWSRAYMKLGSYCDSVDNNMCESFNNWIMESRYLPIISMLEWIRCKIMRGESLFRNLQTRKREEGEAPKGIKMSKVGGQITCSSCNRTGHNMKSCTNNAAATKHHGNAHIVRERSRKRKLQKEAYEAETSKKSKAEEVARQSKGKAVAQDLQVHECRRPTGIQIREPNSQPSSLPVSQPSSLKYDKHAPGSKARSAKLASFLQSIHNIAGPAGAVHRGARVGPLVRPAPETPATEVDVGRLHLLGGEAAAAGARARRLRAGAVAGTRHLDEEPVVPFAGDIAAGIGIGLGVAERGDTPVLHALLRDARKAPSGGAAGAWPLKEQ
uniref:MULE transposase domain-containing protein n=1 Tax=Aegilops tauschii TaxID=37682 RepID=M8C797_AEGTA